MLKSTTALLLVYAVLAVTLTPPVTAQQRVHATETKQATVTTDPPNLEEVFAKQTIKVLADSAVFDPFKTERERSNRQAQKKGWSTTKKTWVIIAVAVGIAAVTFLAIKYYRKCLRYSDSCTYDPNTGIEDCPCEEYAPRN